MKEPRETLRVPFHRPALDEAEVLAVSEVVRSGWLTMGPKTLEFERAFADYIGAPYAIAVSSGTAALHLALEAVGVEAGSEVILPTTTFTATAEVVVYLGARPVLVDIDPVTMNLDPTEVARHITTATRAILPVHLAGQPCDLREIHALSQQHRLPVIEDAAHALPASYSERRIGTLSTATAFSFYATKPLSTGEGGMITTQNGDLAERMRMMRLHGISRDAWKRYTAEGSWRYEVMAAGYKYNLTDLAAALGLVQLRKSDALCAARRQISNRYTETFSKIEALEVPTVRPGRKSAWHLYILRLRLEKLRINRDRFIEELIEQGIGVSVHFIPLHYHPYYRRVWGYKPGDFPRAECEFARCLSLPIYPTMTTEDVDTVTAAVLGVARKYARH